MSWPARLALGYLAAISLIALALMGADKYRAVRGKWRIPERTLLLTGLLGGTPGAILGMALFRHKIRDWKFRWGLPALLAVQLAAALWLVFK